MVAASDNLAILTSLSALAPRRVRKGDVPTQTTMKRPEPGDAIAASPYANRDGLVVGVADAGRLLHYTSDPHGKPMATYHSATMNKPVSTPQAAIARLEEGDDVDESRHPDLKIVPLKIGDSKHDGRSVIFHGGVAQGTIDPAKVGKQKIVTVSSAAMGPDRHFLDRGKAIDAIHAHFAPDEIEKETETEKFRTVGDLFKVVDDNGAKHGSDGKFTSGGGGSKKDESSSTEDTSEDVDYDNDESVERAQAAHEKKYGKKAGVADMECTNCNGTGTTPYKHIEDGVCFRCGGDKTESVRIEQPKTIASRLKRSKAKSDAMREDELFAEYEARKKNPDLYDALSNRAHLEFEADPSGGGGPGSGGRAALALHAFKTGKMSEEKARRELRVAEEHLVNSGHIQRSEITEKTRNAKGFTRSEADANSVHVGKPGEKVTNHTLTLEKPPIRYENDYGGGYICLLRDQDGNSIKWFTSNPNNVFHTASHLDGYDKGTIKIGQPFESDFIVKDHKTRDGVDETHIKNLKVAKPPKVPKKPKKIDPESKVEETTKMITVGDIFKAEDSSGHEHDAKSGQFTSKSGASYAVKYDHNSKGLALHSGEGKVLGTIKGTAKATKDGTVVQHHGHLHAGGTVGGPKTGTGADEMHEGRMATGRKMAEAHEKFQAQRARFQAAQGAAKSITAGDIFKDVKHDPKTGQFTSSSGAKYSAKKVGGGHTAIHDAKGNHVGRVVSGRGHQGEGGAWHSWGSTHHAFLHNDHGENDTHLGAHVSDKSSENLKAKKAAMKDVVDSHEKRSKKDKSMTVGDIFKKGVRTVGELLKGDVLAVPAPMGAGNYVGSFEETLRRIKGPVCMGSGCDKKPEYDDAGNRIYGDGPSEPRDYPHYLDVVATFPEHAYVRCSDEDKTWKVPYTMDAEKVTVNGEPELVVAQFVPAADATGEEVDADDDDDEDEDAE
jgi:hypothetical protein